MYYHPLMFDWERRDRTLAACQAFVGVWFDGVARHQQAHADALSRFCERQVESARMLSEVTDTAQFAANLLSCAVPEPRAVAELSVQLAGIVVDTHRKLGELVASHGDGMSRSVVEPRTSAENVQNKATNGGRAAARRRAAV